MDPNEISKQIQLRQAELAAEGVIHIAIYGSRARGDARPDSDLDILVDVLPESRFSLLNLVGVEAIISNATGLKANAAMMRSLPQHIASAAAPDTIPVF
jgi:uncharacterized protein